MIAKATSGAILNGYISVQSFDSAQQTLFKAALVASVPLLKNEDDVSITSVTLNSARRNRRRLHSLSLIVRYSVVVRDASASDRFSKLTFFLCFNEWANLFP